MDGGASRSGQGAGAALAGFAGWAIAVPWLARALGLGLDVPVRLEIVDHVVPGGVVLVCAALLGLDVRAGGELVRLAAGALAALGGFWITATHATLLPEALGGVTAWGPAMLHLSAGPPIVAVAVWALLAAPPAA